MQIFNYSEPPWYGPVCPVVSEGWRRETPLYPDSLCIRTVAGSRLLVGCRNARSGQFPVISIFIIFDRFWVGTGGLSEVIKCLLSLVSQRYRFKLS